MPNRSIELHDAVLSRVSFSENEAQLHFEALYIHESDGVPGLDTGRGWFQEAILRIQDAKIDGEFTTFPVALTSGWTRIGEEILENEIPLPLPHKGAFQLQLREMWRETGVVTFSGSGAELELLGEPGELEEFRR